MERKYTICFLLPMPETGPIGGYKIVYEYANRFVALGHEVILAYALSDAPARGLVYGLLTHPINTLLNLRWRVRDRLKHHPENWFKLDPRVRKVYPLAFTPGFTRRFPSDTRFISTAIWTSERLNHFPASCNKIQFIQGYEDWGKYSPENVSEVYRYPMTKICIAEWLCEKVRDAGASAEFVPNGLDFDYFKLTESIENRNPLEVAMLWNANPVKGTPDAVAALKLVREKHSDLHVTAFGVKPRPADIPDWFTYVQRPSQSQHNAIYNTAAIFVASSIEEGWGLTPCEAMQCGAAVACTDIGGYRSFAKNDITALMSPVRDPAALASNICRLIEDPSLRARIATAGHDNIQQFTWQNSVEKFLEVISDET